jgi:uncharacterized protein YecT (DUF1311 family)
MRASNYLLFAACLFILLARAYPQHMNAKDSPCKTDATTVDLANCLWTAWKAEDKDLNAYYLVVSKHVSGDELTDLRHAENAWITFRDLNCKAEKALYDGGTAVGPVYDACMEAMTRHRLAELKTMYDWRVMK